MINDGNYYLLVFALQAVSLWLRNTDYKKVHFLCWAALQAEATIKYEVKLFQRKTVYEILWGYTDHFLEFLANPLLPCPGQKGLSSFVQLQVGSLLNWHKPGAFKWKL